MNRRFWCHRCQMMTIPRVTNGTTKRKTCSRTGC